MRLKLKRNLGREDIRKFGLSEPDDRAAAKAAPSFVEGSVHNFNKDVSEELLKRNLAEETSEPVGPPREGDPLHAVAPHPAITAPAAPTALTAPANENPEADESPVSADNAHEAIDQISRMKKLEKLQAIIDTDTRPTVKKAAQDRLDSLTK